MTEQEIKSNIRYNEELVEPYQGQMRELEEQISSLECLKNKFTTLQTNFGSRQDARKRCLSSVSSRVSQIKIASRYYSGMNDLLNGTEFINAYNGLEDAKGTITRELDRIYMQLDDLSGKLNYRTQRITYWRTQLRNL